MSATEEPRTLGRYQVREEIGRDIAGVLYRGRDTLADRNVVLKVISGFAAPPADQESYENRFFEEARLMMELEHPGIAALYDAGKDRATGALFLVMEHGNGCSLAQALQDGRHYGWQEALSLVGRVADALHHAHENGVVQRDLRPENLLLLSPGEPKLTNFDIGGLGAARIAISPGIGAVSETLYRSPEQVVGEHGDRRTDIFSLGAVAYRLLTGCDAFTASDRRATLSRVMYVEPTPPSHLVSDLPSRVDGVVSRALAKSRSERYPEARSLSEDIADILEGRRPRHSSKAVSFGDVPAVAMASPPPVESRTGGIRPTNAANLERRSLTRLFAGLLAFALIPILEFFRRSDEPSSIGTVSSSEQARGTAPPTTAPGEAQITLPDLGLPSIVEPPERARLVIDFHHPLEAGTLRVFVDDTKMAEWPLKGSVARSILGIKLHGGRARHELEIEPGRHRVDVKVHWRDNESSAAILGAFDANSTRRLSARMGRLAHDLRLDWQ